MLWLQKKPRIAETESWGNALLSADEKNKLRNFTACAPQTIQQSSLSLVKTASNPEPRSQPKPVKSEPVAVESKPNVAPVAKPVSRTASATSSSSSVSIPACPYGAACYRQKNPKHCAEFSHPVSASESPLASAVNHFDISSSNPIDSSSSSSAVVAPAAMFSGLRIVLSAELIDALREELESIITSYGGMYAWISFDDAVISFDLFVILFIQCSTQLGTGWPKCIHSLHLREHMRFSVLTYRRSRRCDRVPHLHHAL
jgi:hypothetical protein